MKTTTDFNQGIPTTAQILRYLVRVLGLPIKGAVSYKDFQRLESGGLSPEKIMEVLEAVFDHLWSLGATGDADGSLDAVRDKFEGKDEEAKRWRYDAAGRPIFGRTEWLREFLEFLHRNDALRRALGPAFVGRGAVFIWLRQFVIPFWAANLAEYYHVGVRWDRGMPGGRFWFLPQVSFSPAGASVHKTPVNLALAWWQDNLGERRKVALLDQILDVVAAEAELTVIWRAVFEAGKRAPETLGLRLVPLLSEPAILVSFDLHYLVAALLELVFPKLKKAERAKIERAVVALPLIRRKQDDGTMRSDDLWRGLYLNQMPLGLMVTAEAKALRVSLQAAKSLRKNVPPYRSWSSTGKMEWSDYVPTLKDVDLKTPEHVAAKEWETKLQAFGRTDGKKHTAEAIDTFWPTLVGAYEFTVKNPPAGIHPDVTQLIWSRVVEGAEQIVRSGVMPQESERRAFLREILLRGALDPKPEIEADTETSFARSPSWGSPSPRIDAAQALIVWPRETRANDDELRAAIRRLVADPHPAVRFQIAGACNTLYDVDRPFMWELIKERAPQEVNAGVWTGLLGAIDRIAPGHQDEAADLFFDYLQRFPRPDEANRDPADTAVAGLSDLFIRFGHARATDYVMKMVADPVRHAHYLKLLCQNFRDTLAVGLRPTDTEFQRNLHRRGLEFFLTLVRNGRTVLDAFMAQGDKAPAPKREEVREVVQLLDGVNMQVFFASGAHDGKRPSAEEPAPPTMEFWQETKPIIDELVTLPSTHIAYHLSETLEFLITADPLEVFRCIVRVVANTKADGFAHEHLAVGVITRIVERYLADYAELFRAHEDLRAGLLQVLDTFADVGWPEARRLIRSLSSLYR